MKKITLALVLLFISGCAAPVKATPNQTAALVDAEVRSLMKNAGVEGLALAVIEGGNITHIATFGRRNVALNLPLTNDTIMYGASLTKTAFAYMLLQLVDEGKLSLDASVADLLPRPLTQFEAYAGLKDDPRWRALTPRILLTHSAGFANFTWLEPDKRLRMHFDPGSRYAYSGQGFYLLQLILEEGLGLDVGKEMQVRVFDRFGMKNSSMSWRADFAKNLADGYTSDGKMEAHDERSHVRAAGSMDTTITDQALMWAGIVRGDGLSAAARAELVRPQRAIDSTHQFPTLLTAKNPQLREIGLSAGLGLVSFQDSSGPAWFKGGHNETTGNLVLCLEHQKRCVVMLSNDVRAEQLYPDIANMILGKTSMPWAWEYDWFSQKTHPVQDIEDK